MGHDEETVGYYYRDLQRQRRVVPKPFNLERSKLVMDLGKVKYSGRVSRALVLPNSLVGEQLFFASIFEYPLGNHDVLYCISL